MLISVVKPTYEGSLSFVLQEKKRLSPIYNILVPIMVQIFVDPVQRSSAAASQDNEQHIISSMKDAGWFNLLRKLTDLL